MKASWERTEKNQGVLTFEADEQKVASALDQAFRKVVKKVNVPGFRKGKVPRPIFEQRFGVESLYQDALDILLPEAYSQAVDETGIEPVDQPEIDIEQLEKGKSLIVKATVTVKPEVTLGQYKGLEIPEKDFTVTAEDVDQELDKMQKQQGQLEPVDGPVADGDHVVIDFEGFVDGAPFEGGKAEKYSLEIGSGSFIPGFEEQLVGLNIGAETQVQVTFPSDYRAEELAGKEAVFQVKLHEVKRTRLPQLDDDFAQDVSDFDTLLELREDTEKKLEEQAAKDEENYVRTQAIELAARNAEIEIPQVMIEHEIDHMFQHFQQNLSYQGMNLELYTQVTGQKEEDIKEQFREDAEKKVQTDLVLDAIGKAEKIEVSEEDIDKEITETATQMQREKEEIRKILEAQGGIDSLQEQIRRTKTIDLLVSSRKVPVVE